MPTRVAVYARVLSDGRRRCCPSVHFRAGTPGRDARTEDGAVSTGRIDPAASMPRPSIRPLRHPGGIAGRVFNEVVAGPSRTIAATSA
jgi:hypothetical protein